MTFKRSRIARSMSFGQLDAVDHPSPSPPLPQVDRVQNVAASAGAVVTSRPPSVLSISAPPKMLTEFEQHGQGNFGDFLQRCYHCNKKMPNDTEIFMYGIMRGFCTLDCRMKQMVFDRVKEISQNARRTKAKQYSEPEMHSAK